MKLTKKHLKNLIKEELESLLDEASFGLGHPPKEEGDPLSQDLPEGWSTPEMEKLDKDIATLYSALNDEDRRAMTAKFEQYVEDWKAEQVAKDTLHATEEEHP